MGDREENHMEKVMEKVREEITGKSHGQNPLHSQAKGLYHMVEQKLAKIDR